MRMKYLCKGKCINEQIPDDNNAEAGTEQQIASIISPGVPMGMNEKRNNKLIPFKVNSAMLFNRSLIKLGRFGTSGANGVWKYL